jgi:hypothetical protein
MIVNAPRAAAAWSTPEEKVKSAGADLMAFLRTEQPACHFADFVERYFPSLTAEPFGEDLRVVNVAGDEVFVRRTDVLGHGGVRYIRGTGNFETAAIRSAPGGPGVNKRAAKSLIELLAHFNNR